MSSKRYTILETVCPECSATVRVFEENGFQTLELHVRRNPLNHNIQQCPQSRALVTTHVRERDLIVTGT